MTSPARVAVLTSHPIQYNAPLFKRLAEIPDLDLTVLYSSTLGTALSSQQMLNFDHRVVWDIDLLDGYRWKVLRNPIPAHPQRRWSFVSPEVCTELASGRYDVLVSFGWAYPVDWLSFFTARLLRIPFLLYGDTDVRDTGSGRIRAARSFALTWLCRHASGALYTGTFNRDFYIRHGMTPERLWFSPWAIDNGRFAKPDREKARALLGLDETVCYFLFVGTLLPRKCPNLLVSAVAQLQQQGHSVGLILAGSGPMEAELRRQVAYRNMTDVHFLGFMNQSKIPMVYAAGDVFVLPSQRDPRATVVNEAMAAGLPIIVSSGTGVWGPGDLAQHGHDALVFPTGDLAALRDACMYLTDPRARADMARVAAARMEHWGYEAAVAGWRSAIDATLNGQTFPPPRAALGQPSTGSVVRDPRIGEP